MLPKIKSLMDKYNLQIRVVPVSSRMTEYPDALAIVYEHGDTHEERGYVSPLFYTEEELMEWAEYNLEKECRFLFDEE